MYNPLRDKEEDQTNQEFNGFYRGVVVNNEDPKKGGRIKVKVFGVFDNIEDSEVLPWAIMADQTLGGLKNVGSSFIPEVDSHVFVFFEGGDHRFPVYFASAPALHDNEIPDLPSESRRDTPELESEEYIYPLSDQSGFPFDDKQEKDGTSVYPQNKVFKTKAGFVFEIDDTEESTRLRIKQPNGNEKVTDINGHVEEVIEGNVSELLKKSYMRQIDNNKYELVNENFESIIKGTETRTVEKAQTESYKDEVTITIDKNKNLTVKGNYEVQIDGDYNINVGGTTNLTSAGDVNIQGSTINLN